LLLSETTLKITV